MGRHGFDGREFGAVDGFRCGSIGIVDMLSAEQGREKRRVEEVVLDDRFGNGGDIWR